MFSYSLSALAIIEFQLGSPLGFVLLMLVYVATSSPAIKLSLSVTGLGRTEVYSEKVRKTNDQNNRLISTVYIFARAITLLTPCNVFKAFSRTVLTLIQKTSLINKQSS